MFVDTAKIYVKAGNGGNGVVSFHREKYVASGGPDGGDGATGGDVVFVSESQLSTLMDFRYKKKYVAQNGEDGKGAKSSGRTGISLTIKVPCGTIIKDAETGRTLADMTTDGQVWVAAKGGSGGWGNSHYATPTRQIPRFARPGIKGEEKELILELKLLADVGLIGFPNVGKSTILSNVSAARPKIANYHFTTLSPNLGVVDVKDEGSFVLADIPGLIEGASSGAGLGHEFLRHIERTRLLIHVVDVSGIEGRNPIEDFDIINKELAEYNPVLASKPQIVAANKADILTDVAMRDAFMAEMEKRELKVFEVSAATSQGLRELMLMANSMLADIPIEPLVSIEPLHEEHVLEEKKPFTVYFDKGVYYVEGELMERLIGSTNLEDTESLQYFQNMLRKKGVIKELENLGIKEGDTVNLCGTEFDFVF